MYYHAYGIRLSVFILEKLQPDRTFKGFADPWGIHMKRSTISCENLHLAFSVNLIEITD